MLLSCLDVAINTVTSSYVNLYVWVKAHSSESGGGGGRAVTSVWYTIMLDGTLSYDASSDHKLDHVSVVE